MVWAFLSVKFYSRIVMIDKVDQSFYLSAHKIDNHHFIGESDNV